MSLSLVQTRSEARKIRTDLLTPLFTCARYLPGYLAALSIASVSVRLYYSYTVSLCVSSVPSGSTTRSVSVCRFDARYYTSRRRLSSRDYCLAVVSRHTSVDRVRDRLGATSLPPFRVAVVYAADEKSCLRPIPMPQTAGIPARSARPRLD